MAPDRAGSQDASISPCNSLRHQDGESPGKKKGRGTSRQPKRKDRLQSLVKGFKPVGVMLSVIPKKCPAIVRVNRSSESLFCSYCSDIFNFSSCSWQFCCIFPLICGVITGAWPAHIHSESAFGLQVTFPRWIAELHQEIWVCTIASLQENNLSMQWKSVFLFYGSKYEKIFPISAAWQSHKLTHITICVNSSFT